MLHSGAVHGAAVEAVKSFFPEIVKGSVILLFVIILGPLLIFTALPNILFGFDSATAPDIVDFTASAHELEAIYQNIDRKNQSLIDRLVESIGHNHVPISIHVSPKEYEAITTSPTDLRARLRQEG